MVLTFLWLILCGFIAKTGEVKRSKQQKSYCSMLYLLYYYLLTYANKHKPVFYFQSASTCHFAILSPVGWLASDCPHTKIKPSTPYGLLLTCSDTELESWKVLVCAPQNWWIIPFCYLDWKFLPSWVHMVSRMKKKSLSVTKSIRQNNFKHFLQLCRKQWAEFRAQMQAVMNFFYRTQKRLWSYVYPMHTFGACHCTAILPVMRKVRGHSGSILPMHLKTWKRGKWGIEQGIIHFSFGNFKRKFVPHRLIPAVELMVATLCHSS